MTPSPLTETRWETALFASRADVHAALPDRISARAAYQLALFGRAVLVDIRAVAVRRREGEIHPDLSPVLIELQQVPALLATLTGGGRSRPSTSRAVILGSDDRAVAPLLAGHLAPLRVSDVIGGFSAWQEARLPVAAGRLPAGTPARSVTSSRG